MCSVNISSQYNCSHRPIQTGMSRTEGHGGLHRGVWRGTARCVEGAPRGVEGSSKSMQRGAWRGVKEHRKVPLRPPGAPLCTGAQTR